MEPPASQSLRPQPRSSPMPLSLDQRLQDRRSGAPLRPCRRRVLLGRTKKNRASANIPTMRRPQGKRKWGPKLGVGGTQAPGFAGHTQTPGAQALSHSPWARPQASPFNALRSFVNNEVGGAREKLWDGLSRLPFSATARGTGERGHSVSGERPPRVHTRDTSRPPGQPRVGTANQSPPASCTRTPRPRQAQGLAWSPRARKRRGTWAPDSDSGKWAEALSCPEEAAPGPPSRVKAAAPPREEAGPRLVGVASGRSPCHSAWHLKQDLRKVSPGCGGQTLQHGDSPALCSADADPAGERGREGTLTAPAIPKSPPLITTGLARWQKTGNLFPAWRPLGQQVLRLPGAGGRGVPSSPSQACGPERVRSGL